MNDTVQLKEPDKMNWDNYNPGSKYVAPPQVKGVDGKYRTFYGVIPQKIELGVTNEGYRDFLIDPLKVVKTGADADGQEIRFSRVNTKKFTNKKTGEPTEASSVGNFLRAAGVTAKPQSNSEYEAAVNITRGKVVPFSAEWRAKNKDTGEEIRGYDNFPIDPDRPGQRKAVLKKGDLLPNGTTVQSEVLFANLQVRYWGDPYKK